MRPLPPFALRPWPIAAAAFLALAACDRQVATPPIPAPTPAAPPPTPLQPLVDRSELLRALDTAASAFAAGQSNDGADLVGRRFTVRQAFGCAGPAPTGAARPAGLASWTWGPGNRTIELTLQPADWTAELAPSQGEAAEAVEGFWLARPWMRTDACPDVAAPSPAAAEPARQTAGLASVFEQGGSRVGRRDGRAFSHTLRGEDGPLAAPTSGYRLVIEGRFTAFSGGSAVRCRAGGPDERPVCLAAATIDHVLFETAEGQQLSEWRPG